MESIYIGSIMLWNLTTSSYFLNKLHQHLISFGYDVGLTGGCLLKGESNKDLDVIIYPLKAISSNFEAMYQSLPSFGLVYIRLPNNNQGHSDDGKRVEVWEFDKKRIDLLFLK